MRPIFAVHCDPSKFFWQEQWDVEAGANFRGRICRHPTTSTKMEREVSIRLVHHSRKTIVSYFPFLSNPWTKKTKWASFEISRKKEGCDASTEPSTCDVDQMNPNLSTYAQATDCAFCGSFFKCTHVTWAGSELVLAVKYSDLFQCNFHNSFTYLLP